MESKNNQIRGTSFLRKAGSCYKNSCFFCLNPFTARKLPAHFAKCLLMFSCLLLWIYWGPGWKLTAHAAARLQDTGEKLVIVIDPGHGGTNEGTIEGAHKEKLMTLVTAKAMYEELRQYDNVEVYMTRTDDRDMSLKERAEFAKSVDADFLFSLHYNASEYHTMFGAEVWVSCEPPYNAYGYQFGCLQLLEMQDMGLYLRGVKTKVGNKGDYYGILREASALAVPAVIIEHCHVDEERDVPFCDTEEDWAAFGQADARAVAKYFGLSSQTLGVDYSGESNLIPAAEADLRVQSTLRDETSPDVCMIKLLNADYSNGSVELQVTAADYDSPLLYYDYSMDGGRTYSELKPWPETDVLDGAYADTFTLRLQAESGTAPEIIFRAYNLADLCTESNSLPLLQTFFYGEETDVTLSDEMDGDALEDTIPERERHTAGTTTFVPASAGLEEAEEETSILIFLQLCLIFVILLFSAVLISQAIAGRRRRRRRRQRIKEAGKNRNQHR